MWYVHLPGILISIFYILAGVYGWKWMKTLSLYPYLIGWYIGWYKTRKLYVFLGTLNLAPSIADILADILSFGVVFNAPLLIVIGIPSAYYFSDTLSRRRNNLSLLEFLMSEEEKDEDDE